MVYAIVQPSWRGLSVSISRKKICFSDGKVGILKPGLLQYSASSETSILTNISSIFSLVYKLTYSVFDFIFRIERRVSLAELEIHTYKCRMQKMLIIIGLFVLLIGLLYPYFRKLGLWKLPGDIILKGENSSFYFPIVTCLILSIVISITLSFFR